MVVSVVTCKVINRVWIVLLVWMVLWVRVWIDWEMSERVRELYPMRKPQFVIAF